MTPVKKERKKEKFGSDPQGRKADRKERKTKIIMMMPEEMNRFHSVGSSERSDFSSSSWLSISKDNHVDVPMALSTTGRSYATAVDYIDRILKESLEKSANIEDLMFSEEDFQDPTFSNAISADDITELLDELYHDEVVVDEKEISKGNSVTRDIFDPIPLYELTSHHIPTSSDDDDSSLLRRCGSSLFSSNQNVVEQASASHPPFVLPISQDEHRTDVKSSGSLYHDDLANLCSSDEEDNLSDDNGSTGSGEEQRTKKQQGSDDSKGMDYCPKFRGYQTEQWEVRYEELVEFYHH